jgi:hypothetical protein
MNGVQASAIYLPFAASALNGYLCMQALDTEGTTIQYGNKYALLVTGGDNYQFSNFCGNFATYSSAATVVSSYITDNGCNHIYLIRNGSQMSQLIPYTAIMSAGKIDFMSCCVTAKPKTIRIGIPDMARIRIQDFINTTLNNQSELSITINAASNASAGNTAYSAKSQNASIGCWSINGGVMITVSTF